MKFFSKGTAKCMGLLVVSGLICFWGGVKYEQVSRHKQELLLFANVIGDEIIRTNQIVDSIGRETKDSIIQDYNKTVLGEVGCSYWIDYMQNFKGESLASFYKGLNLAFEKVTNHKDVTCLAKIEKLLVSERKAPE